MTKQKLSLADADDLNDGLEYEVDFSDKESNTDVNGDYAIPDAEDESEKREIISDIEPMHKKRKVTSSKLQEKKRVKMESDMQDKKNLSLESSTEVLADRLNSKIRHHEPGLSSLELTERYFLKSELRSTHEFEGKRNLDNLASYIGSKFKNIFKDAVSKNAKSKDERKFVAVLSASALRACDVHRATRSLTGSSLKLINKNKLSADLELLEKTKSRLICSTPGRLNKVLNAENLTISVNEIKIIIVDNSYLDKKLQNIWDMKESAQIVKSLAIGGAKIYLF